MYFIIGIILSVLIYFVLTILFGGIGGLIFLLILTGIIGYLYGEIQKLNERLQKIEKLNGIDDSKDFHVSDEEIEKELEQYADSGENKNE
ncbi:hypothetical protein RJP21_22935 [Paenibacillus sp. VCA1]|uniref:hypothetical protein n=1 Tax=Paenibacillus sp. VCA1 TaxID=3039148 RepID=UPI0028725675|nr:hypothetical protein [Paenibacillus sp. VCA1]MDR9856463.1 hypothetical protein [Paenibacillus sp. VCA1]